MKTWFKIFFRNAKKNWLNISINILGLTLGLTGLIIVLLYINDEESYNRWNPNKDNIYRVSSILPNGKIFTISNDPEGTLFQENIPEITESTLALPWYDAGIIKVEDKKVYVDKITTGENNFFYFFPFDFIKGNKDKLTQSKENIAISQNMATKLFGKQDPIGKKINYNNRDLFVTAIYKANVKSYYVPDIFIRRLNERSVDDWGNYNNVLFLKLQKGANPVKVQKAIQDVLIKKFIEPAAISEGFTLASYVEKYGMLKTIIEPLGDIRLHNIAKDGGPEGTGNYKLLVMLLALSILLIIISCVNFINLSIASATQRAKEVGVKKNLGLSKIDLIKQYTLEIVFQGFAALLLALVLAELLLPSFNEFTQKEIILLNANILIKVSLITLVISFVLGLVPAFHLSNFKAIEVLKGNFSRSKKGVFVRNTMLTLQIIISGFFIIGVFVIHNQIQYLSQKDLGFKGDQILSVNLNGNKRDVKYELMKKELIKNPSIQAVSSAFINPGFGTSGSTNLRHKEKLTNALSNNIDYNYLDFLQIKLLKGRGFSPKFASDTISSVILNETATKQLGIYNDPIGKKVDIGWQNDGKKQPLKVIGVIKDYNVKGFDNGVEPMFMLHWNSYSGWRKKQMTRVLFKIKPKNVAKTIATIQNYWQENVGQDYPFTYEFVNKKFAKTYEKYQKQQTLFSILSTTVILIALLGLFALATLTIQQRLKEVAIRKTLGASVQEIMFQLIKNFLKIVVIASIILLPIAYYFMQNWLENFVYRIDMPIWPFIITPIILLLLVFSVVGIKAYNATKIDLIKYLKFE